MSLTFAQLTPVFAAEASPIDLRQVRDRETLDAIRAGMDRYAVLVFRDQRFTDEEQIDFAQRFDGTLHTRTSSSVMAQSRLGSRAAALSGALDRG